jgi:hypothetical protein
MKSFVILLTAVGALAATPVQRSPALVERDLATITNVIASISTEVDALDSAAKSFSGDGTALGTAAQGILSAINTGNTQIAATDALSDNDALSLASVIQNFATDINNTVSDVIAIKDALVTAGLGQTIYQAFVAQRSASGTLATTITSKVPTELQSVAAQLAATITDALQRGVDAFTGTGGSSSSSSSSAAASTSSASDSTSSSAASTSDSSAPASTSSAAGSTDSSLSVSATFSIYTSSTPVYSSSAPESTDTSPESTESAPVYSASAPESTEAATGYSSSSSPESTGSPAEECSTSTPVYGASAPGYSASAPVYGASTPASSSNGAVETSSQAGYSPYYPTTSGASGGAGSPTSGSSPSGGFGSGYSVPSPTPSEYTGAAPAATGHSRFGAAVVAVMAVAAAF